MKKFIHIGLPKTLSSALQLEFFSKHQDIHFLGVGNGSLIDYIDDEVNFVFETLLLYAKDIYFSEHKEKTINKINSQIDIAKYENKKILGVSSEWLSFNLSPDMIDNSIKSKRLYDLFGDDTKIIIFIRNQANLLKSLYGQYIREGLPLSYYEFMNYIHNFKDRNFYFDLHFDKTFENYSRLFGLKNIHVLPIEDYINKDKTLIKDGSNIKLINELCNIFDITYPKNFTLPIVNPSLTKKEMYQKLLINKENRHDFGNLIFEHSNIHRSREYFKKEGVTSINDYFKDIKTKRIALKKAKKNALIDSNEIDFQIDNNVKNKLEEELIKSNEKLSKKYNIKLPESYFQLNF